MLSACFDYAQQPRLKQVVVVADVDDVLHEVVVKEYGDEHQQLEVDGLLLEGVVEAGAVHAELFGEPCHRLLLLGQFGLYALAYFKFVE